MNMKKCKASQSLIAASLYGELSEAENERLETHLAICVDCRAQAEQMRDVVSVMGIAQQPEMPEHFWEGYWDRVRERMAGQTPPQPAWWEQIRTFMSQHRFFLIRLTAATALLTIGVLAGVLMRSRDLSKPVLGHRPEIVAPLRESNVQTQRLLDQSKLLLLGFANEDFSQAQVADFAPQRDISLQLLRQAHNLRPALRAAGNPQLEQLVDELELVLMQIANLERQEDLRGVELIRDGIDHGGLLFKINIEEMKRQARTMPASTRDLPL